LDGRFSLGDNGYDADSFINSLEVRAIKASFRRNQAAKSNGIATSHYMPNEILSSDFSMPSGIIEVSRHATKDRTQLLCRTGLGLRTRLIWMTTGPNKITSMRRSLRQTTTHRY
jgi:hypothetical protein